MKRTSPAYNAISTRGPISLRAQAHHRRSMDLHHSAALQRPGAIARTRMLGLCEGRRTYQRENGGRGGGTGGALGGDGARGGAQPQAGRAPPGA
jgi:hypothetical protein